MPYSREVAGDSGRRLSERGGSRLKTLMTLAILGSMAFAVVKIVPPYFANYQFQDAIETESRFALTGYPKRNQDDIQNEVYKKAQDLGLPVQREDIHVDMTNTTCDISLDYSVPIDLKFYQFVVPFHDHADNHTI
jgi:nitrogen fixation protein FixH